MTRLAIRGAVGASALLGAEMLWAISRPAPAFDDLDATGVEGPAGHPPLSIAILGDSSCTGPGLERPDDIWARVMARELASRFRVEISSLAIGGSRASDIVQSQLRRAAELQPDIAMVSVGGNDALKGVSKEEFEFHLTTIAATLAASVPLVVFSGVGDLGSIPRLPPPLSQLFRRRGLALDEIHRRVGTAQGVVVADQWAWAAQQFASRPDLFSEDLFHPNAEGHRLWARVALETLRPHLPSTD